jgi:hypothetical protein
VLRALDPFLLLIDQGDLGAVARQQYCGGAAVADAVRA